MEDRMKWTHKTWVRIVGAVLLLAVAVSGWGARWQQARVVRQEDERLLAFADEVPNMVQFDVESEQLLVLVMRPHQNIIWLSDTAGDWIATASMGPDDTLSIRRGGDYVMDVWTPGDAQ